MCMYKYVYVVYVYFFALKHENWGKYFSPGKKVKCKKDNLFPAIYLMKVMKQSSYEVVINNGLGKKICL